MIICITRIVHKNFQTFHTHVKGKHMKVNKSDFIRQNKIYKYLRQLYSYIIIIGISCI